MGRDCRIKMEGRQVRLICTYLTIRLILPLMPKNLKFWELRSYSHHSFLRFRTLPTPTLIVNPLANPKYDVFKAYNNPK